MTSISITWHIRDGNACPICKAINGYTWTFTDGVPDELVHPEFGVVWTIQQGSAAHEVPGTYGYCRCSITNEIDLSNLIMRFTRIRDLIKASLESPELEVTQA